MSESSGEFSLDSLDTLSLLAIRLVPLEPYPLRLSAPICARKCQTLWIPSLSPPHPPPPRLLGAIWAQAVEGSGRT